MQTAEAIIAALDGSAAVARATGWPLTTIEGWKEVNYIPAWRHADLLKLAKALSKPLAAADFPLPSARKSRRPATAQAAA